MLPHLSRLAPLALMLMLPSCSALGALNGAATPLQTYELQANTAGPKARAPRDLMITVEEPETSGALNTTGILIRPTARQASYLADGEWADDLPLMVQTLMLRALQSTGGYSYVGREPLGLDSDYALLTELIDFQAEIDAVQLSPIVQITVLVRIIRERDTRITGSKEFTVTVPAQSDTADAITRALEIGMGRILPDITTWVMERTGVAVKR